VLSCFGKILGQAYSPPRRGGVDAAFLKVAKPPKRRRRGGQVGEVFRPEDFPGLTTPSAPLQWLHGILLVAQPPLLCEEGNVEKR